MIQTRSYSSTNYTSLQGLPFKPCHVCPCRDEIVATCFRWCSGVDDDSSTIRVRHRTGEQRGIDPQKAGSAGLSFESPPHVPSPPTTTTMSTSGFSSRTSTSASATGDSSRDGSGRRSYYSQVDARTDDRQYACAPPREATPRQWTAHKRMEKETGMAISSGPMVVTGEGTPLDCGPYV